MSGIINDKEFDIEEFNDLIKMYQDLKVENIKLLEQSKRNYQLYLEEQKKRIEYQNQIEKLSPEKMIL